MAVYQTLTVKEVGVDTLANTSRVQILWKSQQTGPSHNDNTRTAKYWVTVNGEKTEHSLTYSLPEKSTKTILNETITVLHREDGTGSVTVDTWMDTRISAGEVTLSKSIALTAIPRASTVGATDAFVESTTLIAVGRKSEEYTHSIRFSFGALSGYIDADGKICDTEIRHTAANIPFLIPTMFYAQMPDRKSLQCRLLCRTYQEDTQVGSDQTAAFTVTAREELCKPDIQASVQDINPVTVALTGNPDVLVRYASNARCVCTPQAKNDAAIADIRINDQQCGGALECSAVETGAFSFSVQDSRGFSTALRLNKTLIPYAPVTLNAKVTRLDPTSGKGILEASGQCFAQSFGAAQNSLTLRYSVNGAQAQTAQVHMNDQRTGYTVYQQISGLDYMKSNSVEITLSDLLTKKTQSVTVKPGIPVFDWGEKDFALHVPLSLTDHRICDVGDPVEETDGVNKAYADKKISVSKVWENPSPTLAFVAQTIELQFSAGDLAQVFFAEGIDASARCSVTVQCGKKGRVLGKYGNYLTHRTAAVEEYGVEISEGSRMMAYGEWSTADKVLIPVSVYKITGLTDITAVAELHAVCGTFLCGEVAAGQ